MGGGACVVEGGVCMAGGMHGGRHAWHGVCLVGGVHGRGACVEGGHVWKGGMCGRGCALQGGMHGRGAFVVVGACMPHMPPPSDTTRYSDTVNERVVRILLECILV